MSKGEKLTIGSVLLAVSLSFILKSEMWAWLLLVVGLVLIIDPYWQDYRYGKDRPSREEMDRMSAAEHKKKLYDPKFRRWVDRVYKSDRRYDNLDDYK